MTNLDQTKSEFNRPFEKFSKRYADEIGRADVIEPELSPEAVAALEHLLAENMARDMERGGAVANRSSKMCCLASPAHG